MLRRRSEFWRYGIEPASDYISDSRYLPPSTSTIADQTGIPVDRHVESVSAPGFDRASLALARSDR